MARHSGKNGIVKSGSDIIDGMTSWDITETEGAADFTAAGDTWEDHEGTFKSFSGSITMRADHEAAANQTLRAGDVITLQCYSEGDASGKTYFEGEVRITDHGISASHDSAVERTYSFQGKGALTITTVSP